MFERRGHEVETAPVLVDYITPPAHIGPYERAVEFLRRSEVEPDLSVLAEDSASNDIVKVSDDEDEVPGCLVAGERRVRDDGVSVVLDLVDLITAGDDVRRLEFDDEVPDAVVLFVPRSEVQVSSAALAVPALDGVTPLSDSPSSLRWLRSSSVRPRSLLMRW